MSKSLRLVGVAWAMTGCATSLSMSSSPPGATVYEGEHKIGTTPLDISDEQVKIDVAGGHLLRVEEDGYERVYVWVPAGARKLSFSVNLVPFARDRERQRNFVRVNASPDRLDRISARLLKLQSELLAGEGNGGAELDALVSSEGGLGASYYLSALAALRATKVDDAKEKLKIAIELSPHEADYYNLYRQIGGAPLVSAATVAAGSGSSSGSASATGDKE